MVKIQASVIIPNWNGKHLLKICLPSLKKQSFKKSEVIIVDNGSTDGSVEYIQKYYSEFKIIRLPKNIGFAPAVNLGIKQAKGKFLVLINNDTKVDRRCIECLVKAANKHPEVGMVAAKMLQFHNPSIINSAGDYIDVVGHANSIGLGKKDNPEYAKAGYVFLVTGGGSLFKRHMLKRVGLFDNSYFAYMEDVDLCFRAQLAGFKGWYEPKAVIYHIHKATSSKNPKLLEYLQFRNMVMTVIKNFPPALLKKDFNWLRILLVNLNTVRFLASQGFFQSALKAEIYILFHLPSLLKRRQEVQALKKVTDEYIIGNVRQKRLKIPLVNIRI